ncbi:helix-turn-helix transcriptional regulator [Brevibacillus sp. TJ4]|uniref:helix-turn-helix transcriptional regulator n=1 Tax=Brevibacillus sp. TJ4 TaxID=3234853 RepID=UPI0037D24D8D
MGISIHKEASQSSALPDDGTPGGRISCARRKKNMLLVDLSKATSLSVVSLRMAEQNKTSVTPANLRKLAAALEVSIAYLGCFEGLPEDTLGQQIKKARLYHGHTKRELGDILGLSPRMIQGWEKDEYFPTDKYMQILKDYLKILEK